jgi:hypothetical protein
MQASFRGFEVDAFSVGEAEIKKTNNEQLRERFYSVSWPVSTVIVRHE